MFRRHLQGFDSLCWDFSIDKHIAITQNAEIMNTICSLSHKYGVDLIFGYIEREDDSLYSSCAVVINGRLAYNYRRISRGWKNFRHTDEHYREGNSIVNSTIRLPCQACNLRGYVGLSKDSKPTVFDMAGVCNLCVKNGNRSKAKNMQSRRRFLPKNINIGSLSTERNRIAGGTFTAWRSNQKEYGVESILFIEIE